ncbi:sensor domain-containing protein [Aeromicrobium sp. UC242_57]|uniref:sensor domain-containing protein n=1 Tax=Aeromicrobium sp. UC242_57 TaxID=3374624 RepID=UPI0037B6F8B5
MCRSTGIAIVYVVLAVPALAMLVALTTSLSVAIVGVGLVLLLVLVPINQQLTNLHRMLSGWVLGTKIENPYLPRRGNSPWSLLKAGQPIRRDGGTSCGRT